MAGLAGMALALGGEVAGRGLSEALGSVQSGGHRSPRRVSRSSNRFARLSGGLETAVGRGGGMVDGRGDEIRDADIG